MNVAVAGFEQDCTVTLPVPCSFDFNVAATKYFDGLTEGAAPLALLFSGSVFYRDPADRLQIAQIPWSKEASCQLPIGLWRQMIDRYYPDGVWLRLPRALFEDISRYKRQRGLPTLRRLCRNCSMPPRRSPRDEFGSSSPRSPERSSTRATSSILIGRRP